MDTSSPPVEQANLRNVVSADRHHFHTAPLMKLLPMFPGGGC